ncbi:MAG: hypothetical protein ACLSCZ_11015 [Ruminococcus sp.]|jgi:hypothetical protein|uniref:hypothetical protein n=1 Tax=Roseburia inulinivorans TaxID=360807 RepID=UPI0020623722|nr:MAG TPA: hypothetical protein [Caudoviricetes sp.]
MKVYELIQQLSKFNADTEVEFHVKAKFDADVEAEFDRDDEDDTQEVTVTVEFNDDVDFCDIDNNEGSICPNVTINLEY